jgi:hypothetical protein
VEPRRGANEIGSRLEGDAALGLGIFQLVDRGEMPVGQRCVGEWPEMLGRLELRRIRWQEQQMDMRRDTQLAAGMPPRAIQYQHDLLARAGTDLARKLGQFDLKERNGDTRRQVKDGTPRGGMDKAHKIAPIVAMLHRRGRAYAVETPDLLEDRLQPDAVLVDRPELDARLRVGGRNRLEDRSELFLNAVCSAGSASTWRGRGLSRLPSRRTR